MLVVTADEELLKSLRESNKLLEQVQKGLADYLETKRLAFPRFYFLSNDEVCSLMYLEGSAPWSNRRLLVMAGTAAGTTVPSVLGSVYQGFCYPINIETPA